LRPGDPPQPEDPAAQRTARALAEFSCDRIGNVPAALLDGEPVSLEDAIATAASLLRRWRQPLFAGLGTDVAGARALVRLGLRCGAILDHAHGDAMMQALRALQDRGGFTCTLSEIRNRADLIVCIGTDPTGFAPDFFARCGIGESVDDAPALREVVFLGGFGADRDGGDTVPGSGAGERAQPDAIAGLQGLPGVQAEAIDFGGADLHQIIAELNAACLELPLQRAGPHWPALQALAVRLQAAQYAVLMYAPAQLPGRHAALLVEAIGRIVKTLNRRSRAGALALGAADGSAAVGHVMTWLTGLPLRTALHAHGFDHDPHRFGTRRLLANGAVDGLLWVSSFRPDLPPPGAGVGADALPVVVLGHPAMAAALRAPAGMAGAGTGDAGTASAGGAPAACVFIPVSTPGVNAAGHLFRGDGSIALPLRPFMASGLPSVADVAARILGALEPAA
jgi:formylmethanofuran dehydrogenase subunit B